MAASGVDSGGHLRLTWLVQFAIVAAVGLYGASLAKNWLAPTARQQRVYAIGPGVGSQEELQALLDKGWRVAHVATSSTTVNLDNTVYNGFLLEHKDTKEQEFLYMDPRNQAGREGLQGIGEKMKQGYRLTQTICTAAPRGGDLQGHTLFVLER